MRALIDITVQAEVDMDAWAEAFNVLPAEVEDDIRRYINSRLERLELVR